MNAMGTVKDICWSSKYRKQSGKSKKTDNDMQPNQTIENAKTTVKNIITSIKLKTRKQESCHSLLKKNDTLEQVNSATSDISHISLCVKTNPKPYLKKCAENASKDSNRPYCCPADDCPLRKLANNNAHRGRKLSPRESVEKDVKTCCYDVDEDSDNDENVKGKKGKKNAKNSSKENGKSERPKRKTVKRKRTKLSSSVSIIADSAQTNCCACCGLLAEYFKEVLRLFNGKDDTRISDIFCEMLDVAGCICNDCLNLLLKLLSCVCSFKS